MYLFDVYPLYDVSIVRGRGCKVWDDKGQDYLDLYGGHAVISIGHSHPHYIDMMTKQLQKLSTATLCKILCNRNCRPFWVRHVGMMTISSS